MNRLPQNEVRLRPHQLDAVEAIRAQVKRMGSAMATINAVIAETELPFAPLTLVDASLLLMDMERAEQELDVRLGKHGRSRRATP